MLMNNSTCKEGKDHQELSILHHTVSSHSNDKGNILIKVSGHHFHFNLDMHINEETNMFEFQFHLIQSD
jgi:hypothetical protein